jgi:hypothetical protein
MANDPLNRAKISLAAEIGPSTTVAGKPIPADPWVISSLLQKSIRRSETELAHRAVQTLFKFRGTAIWRRLMVIAFEDVGIGSVETVLMTVAAASDAGWRKSQGGNVGVAVQVVGLLADAPKDRSADHLAGAQDHPAFTEFTRSMANHSMKTRLVKVADGSAPLVERAIAVTLSSGLISDKGRVPAGRTTGMLLDKFRQLGVPEDLVVASDIAAAKMHEPITLMVPLLWLAGAGSKHRQVRNSPVPPLVIAGEVPLYALDEHTRLGRQAIRRFAAENEVVRACLERLVPAGGRVRAVNLAAFYADAAPVAKRLVWDQSDQLQAFGIERDFLRAGVPVNAIAPLLGAARANLGHLNELRAQVLVQAQRGLGLSSATRRLVQ